MILHSIIIWMNRNCDSTTSRWFSNCRRSWFLNSRSVPTWYTGIPKYVWNFRTLRSCGWIPNWIFLKFVAPTCHFSSLDEALWVFCNWSLFFWGGMLGCKLPWNKQEWHRFGKHRWHIYHLLSFSIESLNTLDLVNNMFIIIITKWWECHWRYTLS